jgi:hypothetical protein
MTDLNLSLSRRVLALCLAFGLIAPAGGVQGAPPVDPARAARLTVPPSAITVESLDLAQVRAPDTPASPVAPGPSALRSFTFDFTSSHVSYLVYAEAAGGSVDLEIWSGQPERPYSTGSTASFVFPGSDKAIIVGKHNFYLDGSGSAEATVRAYHRTGGPPSSGTLDLNLYVLAGCGLTAQQLSEGVSVFASVYAEAGIGLGRVSSFNVTGGERFLSPSDTDELGELSKLLTTSASNRAAANLFFIKSMSGLYGFSQGIPAALGLTATISGGVVVVVDTHQTDQGFDSEELGQTMAHETGHSLGLFHTSERDGSRFDTITDTARCTAGPPLSSSGCPDGQNFMFWSGTGFDVSTGQAYVLRRSPIVR